MLRLLAVALSASLAGLGVGTAQSPGQWGDYIFSLPPGWNSTVYPDGLVAQSPFYDNGERCQLTLFPPRPATGNLANDAFATFGELFKVDPRANSSYPFPAPVFGRGVSPQGWPYFLVRKSIRGQVGDYGSLLSVMVVAMQTGSSLHLIVGTSKDPLVSRCLGRVADDVWPRFYHSLRVSQQNPAGQQPVDARALVGTWTTATTTLADGYTFEASGRYSAAGQTRFGGAVAESGSYSVRGNALLLAGAGGSAPVTTLFRLVQESTDLGRTWTESLCLLPDAGGEVCYTRGR